MLLRRASLVFALFCLPQLVAAPSAHAQDLQSSDISFWVQNAEDLAKRRLAANVLNNGAVIASPSRSQPNYYYHWTRDAALTMQTIADLYDNETDPNARAFYFDKLRRYVGFVLKIQLESNLSGSVSDHFANVGEPKFEVDGRPYGGPWGRPQSDGAALRAIGLMRLYTLAQTDAYVQQKLGSAMLERIRGAIANDLEFVVYHWRESSFDPWEEVRGDQFYNRLVQRRALVIGASFASNFLSANEVQLYQQNAAEIASGMGTFWDYGKGYLVATRQRDGGLDYKSSNLDAQVILAALHASSDDERFYSASDDVVLATAHALRVTFKNNYAINGVQSDNEGHGLAPGIGRYPEDRYNGAGGFNGGNPWFLCTAALAELHYRAAVEFASSGSISVSSQNVGFLSDLGAEGGGSAQVGETISGQRLQAYLRAMVNEGDNYLARERLHIGADGEISEQFDRGNGFKRGARDLSWSYASLLTAAKWRRQALGSVQ